MNHYHHFNAFERQLIQIRAEEGNSLQSIADELHRSKSSVWREINRFPSSSYDAPAAQEQYFSNRRKCHQKRKLEDLDLSEFIQNCITEKHWSPEQIANRLKIEHAEWSVSYTTIYRGIYRDNLSVAKTAGQRGLARRLRHRGKEFARHLEIEKEFDLPFYFPEPHSPWQRGTNENTNGLIREYFPKGQEIADFTDEYIMMAMNQINSRPRKTHYWHSAKEVYLRKTFHLV